MKKIFFLNLFLTATAWSFGAPRTEKFDEAVLWEDLLAKPLSENFKGYRSEAVSPEWTLENGVLRFLPKGREWRGFDLVTKKKCLECDVEMEFVLPKDGNSGLFFWLSEDTTYSFENAPEVQWLGPKHGDAQHLLNRTASLYDLFTTPPEWVPSPVQKYLLKVRKDSVELLQGEASLWKAVFDSDDFRNALAKSKFKAVPSYLKNRSKGGSLGIQDHRTPVEVRALKVRWLSS